MMDAGKYVDSVSLGDHMVDQHDEQSDSQALGNLRKRPKSAAVSFTASSEVCTSHHPPEKNELFPFLFLMR